MGAGLPPLGTAVDQGDIVERADLPALAAGDAAIRGAEGLGLDKIAVHALVDHAGLDLVQELHRQRLHSLPGLDPPGGLLHLRARRAENLPGSGVGGRLKHHKIVIRHDDGQKPPIGQALFRAEVGKVLLGVAGLAAAGHHKIGVLAALEAPPADPLGKDSRNPPGVGGADEDPGCLRLQVRRHALADLRAGIEKGISQPVGEQLGAVAAVAGGGKIDDHGAPPMLAPSASAPPRRAPSTGKGHPPRSYSRASFPPWGWRQSRD